MIADPLRPAGSRAWTPVSRGRAESLRAAQGFEVQYRRFVGREGWRTFTAHTQHECRTSYRARKLP